MIITSRKLKKNSTSKRINNPMKKWIHDLNREFSNKEIQMAKKYMKKFSPSLAIKEMQIKTTVRFHLRIIKYTNNNKCL
jgi:hypothetical protein